MAGEKETICKEEIKYAGIFVFKDVYNYMHDWLLDEHYDVIEDSYTEKVSGDEKDVDVIWTAKKKLTDYYRCYIDIKISIKNMKDVEVEVNGKRKKMNQAVELKITFKGINEIDYDNRFGKRGSSKFLKELYNRYIVPDRTKQIEKEIIKDTQDLKTEVKALLDLSGLK